MTERAKEPAADSSAAKQPSAGSSLPCPHCAHPELVQLRASKVVAVYKCPNCGELVAPVNRHIR